MRRPADSGCGLRRSYSPIDGVEQGPNGRDQSFGRPPRNVILVVAIQESGKVIDRQKCLDAPAERLSRGEPADIRRAW